MSSENGVSRLTRVLISWYKYPEASLRHPIALTDLPVSWSAARIISFTDIWMPRNIVSPSLVDDIH